MSGYDPTPPFIDLLSTVPYFEGLSEDVLQKIAGLLVRRKYEPGETVFFEGDPGNRLHIIGDGYLKAFKTSADGREQVLQILGPQEIFGAVTVFHAVQNPATVIALEHSVVYSIGQDAMRRLITSSNELAYRIIDNLAARVLHLVKLVEDLSLRTVEARLARMLLEKSKAGLFSRRKWTTQAEMAAHLGTVPDVLNRALRSFVEEGVIELDRHQIKILERDILESKAMIQS